MQSASRGEDDTATADATPQDFPPFPHHVIKEAEKNKLPIEYKKFAAVPSESSMYSLMPWDWHSFALHFRDIFEGFRLRHGYWPRAFYDVTAHVGVEMLAIMDLLGGNSRCQAYEIETGYVDYLLENMRRFDASSRITVIRGSGLAGITSIGEKKNPIDVPDFVYADPPWGEGRDYKRKDDIPLTLRYTSKDGSTKLSKPAVYVLSALKKGTKLFILKAPFNFDAAPLTTALQKAGGVLEMRTVTHFGPSGGPVESFKIYCAYLLQGAPPASRQPAPSAPEVTVPYLTVLEKEARKIKKGQYKPKSGERNPGRERGNAGRRSANTSRGRGRGVRERGAAPP